MVTKWREYISDIFRKKLVLHGNGTTCDNSDQSSPLSGYARTICTTKGHDCEDVYHHFSIVVPLTAQCQCVEIHLGGVGKRSHVDTRTPTPHAEIWMGHNSSPQFGSVEVSENQDQCLHQWKSIVCSAANSSPLVALPAFACDHSAAQYVLQVLTFFEQVIHNQAPTDSWGCIAAKGKACIVEELMFFIEMKATPLHVFLVSTVSSIWKSMNSKACSRTLIILLTNFDRRI